MPLRSQIRAPIRGATLVAVCIPLSCGPPKLINLPGYIQLDYDPTKMPEFCNKSSSLGSLALSNFQACANCVQKNGELSSYFDRGDAQDALDIVNLCQSNFATNHSEMVSAMSVISKIGGVVGTIATASFTQTSTSIPTTSASTTNTGPTLPAPASPTPNPPGSGSSDPDSQAWIAGPVVGSVAGVAIIVIAVLFIRKRHKRRQAAEATADDYKGGTALYDKPELPAEGIIRHELDAQPVVETTGKSPPQELHSGEISELPANKEG